VGSYLLIAFYGQHAPTVILPPKLTQATLEPSARLIMDNTYCRNDTCEAMFLLSSNGLIPRFVAYCHEDQQLAFCAEKNNGPGINCIFEISFYRFTYLMERVHKCIATCLDRNATNSKVSVRIVETSAEANMLDYDVGLGVRVFLGKLSKRFEMLQIVEDYILYSRDLKGLDRIMQRIYVKL